MASRKLTTTKRLEIANLLTLVTSARTYRLWSGYRLETFFGEEFMPTGTLGDSGKFEDTIQFKTSTVELTLLGLKEENQACATTEIKQGNPINLYYVDRLPPTKQWGTPQLIFSGYVDTLIIADNKLTLTCSYRFSDWARRIAWRWTKQDCNTRSQKQFGINDTACDQVDNLENINLTFP